MAADAIRELVLRGAAALAQRPAEIVDDQQGAAGALGKVRELGEMV